MAGEIRGLTEKPKLKAEKGESKRKPKMRVFDKSVFKIGQIIVKKAAKE